MIFRIGIAVAALIWIHGLDRTRDDISAATASLKDEAPRAALAYCANNATQCQDLALRAVTGTVPAQAPVSAPAPITASVRRDAAGEAAPLPLSAGSFPLPPRRPRS
jgi:hypothetical protein